MKYARTENNIVVQTIGNDPANLFAPEYAVLFRACSAAVQPGWSDDGATFTAPPTPDPAVVLTAARAAALLKIDAETDDVYGDVVGNKGEEYRSAEADAKAFIAANYTGTAGSGVTSWATAKGWTTTQAANDIIAQATAWRNAQAAIRANRLARKEAVRAAADLAALNAIMAQWSGFLTAIRTQLGV